MAALLVDGPSAVTLTAELDRIASDAARAYGLAAGSEVELHGHEIFHAAGNWKGVPPRARIGIFDDVIEAVVAQSVHVIARAMDVIGHRARHTLPAPPHSVVLRQLLERADEHAAPPANTRWSSPTRLQPRMAHEQCWFPAVDGQQSRWGRDRPEMHEGPA
jgi:hypothetical protein